MEKLEVMRSSSAVTMTVRGCGRLGAYCSQRPRVCLVDSKGVELSYEEASGLLTLVVPVPEKEMHRWIVEVEL